MFASIFRGLARRAATPLARAAAPIAKPLVLAGGASALVAAAATANDASSCEPMVAPRSWTGEAGTKTERTLILVKPDGVERGVVGSVLSKFEAKGYKLVGLKMLTPTLAQAQDNYKGLAKLPFYPGLCNYFASGPIVAMCWEGKDVIKNGRTMVDGVRNVYAADRGRNCIDGSDSADGAAEGMYVMDEFGSFFTTLAFKQEQQQHELEGAGQSVHHSSLAAGAPVAAAGLLTVSRGKLRSLSNESGHYAPPPSCLHTVLEQLAALGVAELEQVVLETHRRMEYEPPAQGRAGGRRGRG